MQYPQQQLRQQQQQSSSHQPQHHSQTPMHQQGPNLRSQDSGFRNRGGGGGRMMGDSSTFSTTTPYRDDPTNAPVHLESFTRGGYGPTNIDNALDEEYKKKAAAQGFGYRMKGMIQYCCLPVNTTTEEDSTSKYYRDDFNDLSWTCTIGTSDESGIWLNRSDPAGTIMCFMVWILLGYSTLTITLLAETGGIPHYLSYIYTILCSLALAAHVKTTLTDPGSVPPSAVPTEEQRKASKLSMCSQCQTFKPPMSHHCRICNRCISRMDHHCPWMNNCVGAANMKHFCLFLFYTWSCSAFSLLLMGWNYFFCAEDDCIFNVVLTQLVRLMTVLGIGAFLFTSSMIMNVVYGIMTGVGTIDRLKKKATNTMSDSDEEPVDLKDIFGIGPFIMWFFPTDPLFDDYDKVMGYSTPQRLLREQILREKQQEVAGMKSAANGGGGGMSTPIDGSLHLNTNTTTISGGGGHLGVPYGGAGTANGTLF